MKEANKTDNNGGKGTDDIRGKGTDLKKTDAPRDTLVADGHTHVKRNLLRRLRD